jgi:putative ABC transport system substrate-binding protein
MTVRRRDFITLLGGAAAWPVAARAQQPGKLPNIGFLGAYTASIQSQWTAAFVQRLRELGWIEGRTVAIAYRWAEGRAERATELASEFVRLKVDVIVTSGNALAIAAKGVTAVVPIVFALAGDPVGTGLVASLARPGGNVTGLSLQTTDLSGKRLEFLREVVPNLRHLAVLGNVGNPSAVLAMDEARAAGQTLGLTVLMSGILQPEDILTAFETLKGTADALFVVTDPLVTTNMSRINTLAVAARLPTVHGFREHVEAGGLISYGASFTDQFRRAAEYVDKILHGAKPGDIPVEQPTKFELVVNLTTAKALGLTVSPTLLALADEVIE